MSDQPTCPAAASHVAASAIHPCPAWSVHFAEVTTAYTIVCRPASLLHELLELSQKSPVVAASQSVVPHAQFAGLAAVPSVVAQATNELHELNKDVQKSPVPDQQSMEPHLQTPSFSKMPLPSEQAAAWLQLLEEDVQTSPVADVQAPEAPHKQGAGLAVVPSPWAQAGPVKVHRQALELE